MASSSMNEGTPFSVSYVTVPNDDVAKKLAEYVHYQFSTPTGLLIFFNFSETLSFSIW